MKQEMKNESKKHIEVCRKLVEKLEFKESKMKGEKMLWNWIWNKKIENTLEAIKYLIDNAYN